VGVVKGGKSALESSPPLRKNLSVRGGARRRGHEGRTLARGHDKKAAYIGGVTINGPAKNIRRREATEIGLQSRTKGKGKEVYIRERLRCVASRP